MKKLPAHTFGFTLVEILVVVGLLGILITISLSSFSNTLRKGRDSKRKSDLEQLRVAMELYRSENGSYPAGAAGSTEGALKSTLTVPVAYIGASVFPKDPRSSSGYNYYYQQQSSSTYRLCTYLEVVIAGDPVCPGAAASCGAQNCNYGVSQP